MSFSGDMKWVFAKALNQVPPCLVVVVSESRKKCLVLTLGLKSLKEVASMI